MLVIERITIMTTASFTIQTKYSSGNAISCCQWEGKCQMRGCKPLLLHPTRCLSLAAMVKTKMHFACEK